MYLDRAGFVALFMPKTGSTTFRRVARLVGDGRELRPHHLGLEEWARHARGNSSAFVRQLGESESTLVAGTIRHPLGWYGSVYRLAMSAQYRGKGAGYLALYGRQDIRFGAVLEGFLTCGGFLGEEAEPMLNPNPETYESTLYSAAVAHYYGRGGEGLDIAIDLAHQAEDLAALFGVPRSQVESVEPQNVSTEPRPQITAQEVAELAPWLRDDIALYEKLQTKGARLLA